MVIGVEATARPEASISEIVFAGRLSVTSTRNAGEAAAQNAHAVDAGGHASKRRGPSCVGTDRPKQAAALRVIDHLQQHHKIVLYACNVAASPVLASVVGRRYIGEKLGIGGGRRRRSSAAAVKLSNAPGASPKIRCVATTRLTNFSGVMMFEVNIGVAPACSAPSPTFEPVNCRGEHADANM